jgi:peptidoglycan hydrolase CwlO-like protein
MAQKDAEIVALAGNITTTTGKIDAQHEAIVSTLRDLDEEGNDNNIAISLFSGEKFSSFFGNAAALIEIRSALKEHVEELSTLKSSLITTKTATEQKVCFFVKLNYLLASERLSLSSLLRLCW